MKKLPFVKKYILFFLTVFVSVTVFAQNVRVYKTDRIEPRNGKDYYLHTVLEGQTVYSIAKAYNVTPDEIYYENPGSVDGISIDQELWIPVINKETELNTELMNTDYDFFYHIFKEGEDFGQLSALYHIPEAEIRKANPGIVEPVRPGTYVKIPVQNENPKTVDSLDVSFNPDIEVIPGYRHEVVAGETIYSISRKYNVTVAALRAVNPGLGTEIEIGYRLRIPKETDLNREEKTVEEERPQQPDHFKHRVRKKETLYSISRMYGVSVAEILDENPGLTTSIYEGQLIEIPRTTLEQPYIIYVARQRTKLKKVAKQYRMPVSHIMAENPSISNKVYAGQRIKIPVGKKALEQIEKKENELVEVVEKPVEESAKKHDCAELFPVMDKTFNVALMVPLYLEETDSLDIEKFLSKKQNGFLPFRYIDFYEGALLAVDSLRKQGMEVKLSVYDVDQTLTKTAKVLQDPALQTMDLIIGPFHSRSFDQVALFAGNFNIPIVNPLSYREEVGSNYRTAIKVKPDNVYLVNLVRELVRAYYPDDKVFLVTQTSYIDAGLVAEMNREIDSIVRPTCKFSNNDLYNLAIAVANRDTSYTPEQPLPSYQFEGVDVFPEITGEYLADSMVLMNKPILINYLKDSLHPFLDNASPLRGNVVILYGSSKAFFMDAMNRLNEVRDTFNIKIVGLPLVEKFDNIDHIQANNMNLTYFSTYYVDYDSPETEAFVSKYFREYNTEPDVYGFTGFDLTYYFLWSLFNLDRKFTTCLEYLPEKLLLTRYAFGRPYPEANYSNTYWNLIRYEGLQKKKLPDLTIGR